MQRNAAIKLLAKLRETAEHPATEAGERAAALQQIQNIKSKWRIGHYEVHEELRKRRNKPPEECRNITIRFRCTKAEYRKITKAADTAGQSISEFVRVKLLEPKELDR